LLMRAVVLVFCFLVAYTYAQQKQQPIPSILQGEWNLQISTSKLVDNKLTAGDDMHIYLNLSESNGKLSSTYTDWERELHFKISIDWLSVISGEARIAEIKVNEEEVQAEDDSEGEEKEFVGKNDLVQTGKEQLLFVFDFVNRTNGYLFAQGEFNGVNGKHVGSYSIVIPSSVGFIMTIVSKDGSEIITVTASKPQLPGEQSIFQRLMGSPIAMIAIFLMLRTFLSKQTAGLLPSAAGRPAAGRAAGAAGAAGAAAAGTAGAAGATGAAGAKNAGKGGRKQAEPRTGPVVQDVTEKTD